MKNRTTLIGKYFDKYLVTAKIACGSSGCVYLAQHRLLSNRTAAIKVMHTARLDSSDDRDGFLREAEILELLKHPHILPIYDFGIDEDEGLPYLVMEYAPGGSLRDLLKHHAQRPLPVAQSLAIISQVGKGLYYAHQKNIVHRDLKPENILFNEGGKAMLADFSIAFIQNTTNVQNAIDIIGTPPYMAPEQFDGLASRRSDQYSLGCISYELFTGHKPFQAPDTASMIHKHKYDNPAPPTQFNPLLPAHVERAILKAMAKRRINRHTNVSQFIEALRGTSIFRASGFSIPHLSQMSKWQWLAEGIQLRKLQRYQAALEADEQAILLDYNLPLAHNNKGNSLYYLKRYQEALVAYEQAIRLAPTFVAPYNNKAIVLHELRRYGEALIAYEQAIQLDASYTSAYYGKGNALYHLRRYREALSAYEYANRLNPTFALAHYGIGLVFTQLGRYLDALDAYENALQIDAYQPHFHCNKGDVLQQLGKIEEALQAYERAWQLERGE